jgi:hypothetical protein
MVCYTYTKHENLPYHLFKFNIGCVVQKGLIITHSLVFVGLCVVQKGLIITHSLVFVGLCVVQKGLIITHSLVLCLST